MSKKTQHRSILFVLASVAASSSVSMLGGMSIELVADKLIPLVPLLIAMPTLNTMVGDYATVVASYEEAGVKGKQERSLTSAISKSVAINIISLVLLSLALAISRDYQMDSAFIAKYALFIAFATVFSVTAIFVITKLLNRALVNHKLNADDVLIPVITSVTDVMMLGLISLAVVTIF